MFKVVFGIPTFQFLYFKILKLKLYSVLIFFFLALGVFFAPFVWKYKCWKLYKMCLWKKKIWILYPILTFCPFSPYWVLRELFENVKSCVKLRLRQVLRVSVWKVWMSYYLIRCVAGEAVAETGTQRGDWLCASLWSLKSTRTHKHTHNPLRAPTVSHTHPS